MEFAGTSLSNAMDAEAVKARTPFVKAMWKTVSNERRSAVEHILKVLFPRLVGMWMSLRGDDDWDATWRRDLRICHRDIFPVYFRLTTPSTGMSKQEFDGILDCASDGAIFTDRVVALGSQSREDGTTKARLFLEYLLDYAYTAPAVESNLRVMLIRRILDIGDFILSPLDERPEFGQWFGKGNEERIYFIVRQLLEGIASELRLEILQLALTDGKSLYTGIHTVNWLAQEHALLNGKPKVPVGQRTLTIQEVQQLEELMVERIVGLANSKVLMKVPQLLYVLHRWKDWGDGGVQAWTQELMQNGELLELVKKLSADASIQAIPVNIEGLASLAAPGVDLIGACR